MEEAREFMNQWGGGSQKQSIQCENDAVHKGRGHDRSRHIGVRRQGIMGKEAGEGGV